MREQYGEDYFLRGVEKSISNYTDYSWKPELTRPLAQRVIEVMNIGHQDRVLDFGSGPGFLVRALHELSVNAWGYDISEWAVANCDPNVKGYIHNSIQHQSYDHVWMKDCAEHLQLPELMRVTDVMLERTIKSILVIVPLTQLVGGQYVRREDDMDVTHVIRWPLGEWLNFFQRRVSGDSWIVSGSWHIPGLKPSSLACLGSCGFITMKRYEDPKATTSQDS